VFVVSNGEPRTVHELVARITDAAGVDWRPRHVPTSVATVAGGLAERLWGRLGRTDDPPMTSFLAEQLSTAHWFDQRETRATLGWEPDVSLADGFERLRRAFAADGRPG
jgi:nucleoside-diphosphate-sugar epimerase